MQPSETVDARKVELGRDDIADLLSQVDEVYAGGRGAPRHLNLRDKENTADHLAPMLLGPTGRLRAPSLIIDRTLVVGFDQTIYDKVLAGKHRR